MSRQCTVCSHTKTKEIEKLIVQGKPHTHIADKYDLNHQAIRNHANKHLPRRMVLAQRRKQRDHTENILDHLDEIIGDTKSILDEALEKGEKTVALRAIKEARSNMTFLAQIQVKQKEYQEADEERQDKIAEQTITEGLKTLTDEELKTLMFLQAKIRAADPNYVANPTSRIVIDYVNSDRSDYPHTSTDIDEETASSTKTKNNSGEGDESRSLSDNEESDDNSESKSARNRGSQNKISQNQKDKGPQELDDLDINLDDLNLEDDNEIPSEETDPDWRKR